MHWCLNHVEFFGRFSAADAIVRMNEIDDLHLSCFICSETTASFFVLHRFETNISNH